MLSIRALGSLRGLGIVLACCCVLSSCASQGSDDAAGGGQSVDTTDAVDERLPHERIDAPSLSSCGVCHLDVWREWSESLHHKAWTNPNVRSATRDFEKQSCRKCHSPHSVLERDLGFPPRYRDFNQRDGVHCLSCHGRSDGVAATRSVPGAPCNPIADARLSSVDLCYPCHEPTHGAFTEYEQSTAFARGIRCMDCHMPPRADGTGRSHGPHGGLNAEFVRGALEWSCALDGEHVALELRNLCGHNFPGEIPSRSFIVVVSFDGQETQRLSLRKPGRGEQRADERLKPDETRTLRFNIPAGAAEVLVRLLFSPLPLLPDRAAFVIGEWRQDIP